MGMSTHVVGFKPPDDKWKAMKAVWDACKAAKIDPPGDVVEFFDDRRPDASGVEVALKKHPACKEWHDDMQDGFEIDIKKLPPDVTVIRFFNSF